MPHPNPEKIYNLIEAALNHPEDEQAVEKIYLSCQFVSRWENYAYSKIELNIWPADLINAALKKLEYIEKTEANSRVHLFLENYFRHILGKVSDNVPAFTKELATYVPAQVFLWRIYSAQNRMDEAKARLHFIINNTESPGLLEFCGDRLLGWLDTTLYPQARFTRAKGFTASDLTLVVKAFRKGIYYRAKSHDGERIRTSLYYKIDKTQYCTAIDQKHENPNEDTSFNYHVYVGLWGETAKNDLITYFERTARQHQLADFVDLLTEEKWLSSEDIVTYLSAIIRNPFFAEQKDLIDVGKCYYRLAEMAAREHNIIEAIRLFKLVTPNSEKREQACSELAELIYERDLILLRQFDGQIPQLIALENALPYFNEAIQRGNHDASKKYENILKLIDSPDSIASLDEDSNVDLLSLEKNFQQTLSNLDPEIKKQANNIISEERLQRFIQRHHLDDADYWHQQTKGVPFFSGLLTVNPKTNRQVSLPHGAARIIQVINNINLKTEDKITEIRRIQKERKERCYSLGFFKVKPWRSKATDNLINDDKIFRETEVGYQNAN